MYTRIVVLMQMATAPTDKTKASVHQGGWSESFWMPGTVATSFPTVGVLLGGRANLLPKQANITGVRAALYDILGNTLVPKGASTAKVNYPGSVTFDCDMPNAALSMSGTTNGRPNTSRFALRALPDDVVKFGEYQPDAAGVYHGRVLAFATTLENSFGFIGRDLSKPAVRVMSIAGNVLVTNASLGAVAGTSSVIFKGVKDDAGNAVKGSYLVTAANNGTFTYTLANPFAATKTAPGGTVRIDELLYMSYDTVQASRAVVRKIGRPFESYRGRASKRSA